jgi:hypothetical protein
VLRNLSLLSWGQDTSRTTTSGLGVLSSDSGLPEVSETSVESHLLHSLEILTKDTVQQVSVLVSWFSILNILGSVQEPEWDLELLRIGDDGNNLSDLLLSELTSALAHVNVAFLANDVGESSTNTLKERLNQK